MTSARIVGIKSSCNIYILTINIRVTIYNLSKKLKKEKIITVLNNVSNLCLEFVFCPNKLNNNFEWESAHNKLLSTSPVFTHLQH